MIYPQITSKRSLISLDGFWRFAADEANEGEQKGWQSGIPNDREIAVPASWNEQYQDLMNFFETGWYEKDIEIPVCFKDCSIFLRVGSANYLSRVWVNGELAGEHEGAHLPFEFDITKLIRFGYQNKVVIAVDARIKPDRLPPGGVEDEQIVGFKGQYPDNYYDFFPYGGINRPVYIYTTSVTHISDISLNTDIDGGMGIIRYNIKLNRAFTGILNIKLNGLPEKEIKSKGVGEFTGSLEIPEAIFWSMENPYLYQMGVTLLDESNNIIDSYTQSVGIRTIRIDGVKLLLNGKPVFLKGFGMHEDFPVLGKGMNHAIIAKDFNLLKWVGANSIRTSHYPYSEELLNYADRTGLLVIGETPFVGFVKSHYKSAQILEKAKRVINEMISRDRNHPCIIAWSLANEGDTFAQEADVFYKNLYDHAKALDETRPITITNAKDIDRDVASKHFDFISINRYCGWYEQVGRLDLGCKMLDEILDRSYEVFKKPVLVTEFGADAVAGMHFDPPQQFSEEYQAEMITRQYELIKSKHYTIGAHIWVFADFKTSQTVFRVIMNRKGLFTRERQPKIAAREIRKMWRKE